MHNLPKPSIHYLGQYKKCTSVRSSSLKTNLKNAFPLLESAAENYDQLATEARIYKIKKIDESDLLPITPSDLIKLYTQQMAKKGRPARETYDQLMIAAKSRCPFCSHNHPTTLDHYLPKGEGLFPEFSVLPLNLVPCCKDCNHGKLEGFPDENVKQFIHPYYDDISLIQWLEAEVDFSLGGSPTITYFINQNADGLEDVLYKRISYQFFTLALNNLYSIEAGDELSAIEGSLRELYGADNASGVKEHLSSQARSRSHPNKNSWQAAMYRCISENDEFCDMNWSL